MQQGPLRLAFNLRTWVIPFSVLIIGVACSLGIASSIQSSWDAKERSRFDQAVLQTTQEIKGQFERYVTLAQGARGLFASDSDVTPTEFRRFSEAIDLQNHFPGLQAIGFLRVVENRNLRAFSKTESKRQPGFHVWPSGNAEFHAPITFAAPGPGTKDPTGFDMALDPIRFAAIKSAIVERRQTMTRVTTIGGPRLSVEPPEPGFLIFLPIFAIDKTYSPIETTNSKPFGVIFLAFRGARLIQSLQEAGDHPSIAYDLFVGTPAPENFVCSSASPIPNWNPRFHSDATLQLADRVITARFHDTPALEQLSDLPLAREIFVAGIIISSLLFVLTLGTTWSREAALQEIIERRRAEEALEGRERQLSTILDALPVSVWLLDQTGAVIFTNPSGEKLAALQGSPESEIPHIGVTGRKALGSGSVTLNEIVEISGAQGQRMTLLNSAVPLRDNSQQIVGAVVVSEDISQRLHAEAALVETEHRFRVMADLAPVLLWVAGPDQRFTWLNKPWLDYVGQPLDAELGDGWSRSVHEEDLLNWQNSMQAAYAARKPFELEFRLRRADGQYRYFLNRGVPRSDANEDFVGFIGSCVDIEDRKQAEVTMTTINATLERWVAERTRDLKRTVEDMESFSYTVAHDLRAPLRAMGGYAQMLQDDFKGSLPAEAVPYVQRIKENSAKMAQLIDGLLDLARISRAELHRDRISITDIARDISTSLQLRNPERYATIQIEEDMAALGDERLITIVLQNLLENAWKFTEKMPSTRVSVGSIQSKDDSNLFYVKDNGAGFDMAHITKLFGTFERLHKPDEFPGSGIGLASVKRIIERHGGRVWAEAKVGEGATFYFTLPKVAVPTASQASLV